jgi:hypothetical protein
MGSTPRYGITFPNSSDKYALTEDLERMALSTDQALVEVGQLEVDSQTVNEDGRVVTTLLSGETIVSSGRRVPAPPQPLDTTDLDLVTSAGEYYQNLGANATVARHYPIEGQDAGALQVLQWGAASSEPAVIQLWSPFRGGLMFRRSRFQGAWSAWEVWRSGPHGLAEADLDTITAPGDYYQNLGANATAARHYPPGGEDAGALHVAQWGPSTTAPTVIQTYTLFRRPLIAKRSRFQGAWSAWDLFYAGGGPSAGGATDVVAMLGQSNGQGAGRPVLEQSLWSRITQFPAANRAQGIIPAVDPMQHPGPITSNIGVGPAISFARRFIQENPDARVLLVPAAYSGTAFSSSPLTWDWTAPDDGNNLARNALRQIRGAMAASPGARLTALAWHQGEGDSAIADQYAGKLDGLIDWFRTELDAPDLPFIVGQLGRERGQQSAGSQTIDKAHMGTPARVEHTGFARTEWGMHNVDDVTHLSARGQHLLGRSMYEAYERARYNVAGTKPLSPERLVATRRGALVDLSWGDAWSRVTSYRVEWSANGTTWNTSGVTQYAPNDISATVNASTATRLRVVAVNAEGDSAPVYATVATA